MWVSQECFITYLSNLECQGQGYLEATEKYNSSSFFQCSIKYQCDTHQSSQVIFSLRPVCVCVCVRACMVRACMHACVCVCLSVFVSLAVSLSSFLSSIFLFLFLLLFLLLQLSLITHARTTEYTGISKPTNIYPDCIP